MAAVNHSKAPKSARDAFLEEAIVRRELSFNFTHFSPHYDSLRSLPPWAHQTMREHARDPRPNLLYAEQIEAAETRPFDHPNCGMASKGWPQRATPTKWIC